MIGKLLPKSLIGQLLLAVAFMLFVGQAVNFALLARGRVEAQLLPLAGLTAARLMDATANVAESGRKPQGSPATLRQLRQERFVLASAPPQLSIAGRPWPQLESRVGDLLTEAAVPYRRIEARVIPRPGPMQGKGPARHILLVSVERPDGQWLTIFGRAPPQRPRIERLLIGQSLILYALLLAAILGIGWRVSRPLADLTRSVRAAIPGDRQPPITVAGPRDVRDLIAAVNGYRDRIDLVLADKNRMMGAIGHDLRTPLASLRVRVEAVGDTDLRNKMIASIESIDVMLADMLLLARGEDAREAPECVSMQPFCAAIVDEYRERACDVTLGDARPAQARIRPLMFARALRNLIDNALTYGKCARVTVDADGTHVTIAVMDDGPGMDAATIEHLSAPFARAEESRNRTTGGSGLGLPLARMIVEMEGGQLSLANGDGGGLVATVILPQTKMATP